MTLNAEDIEKLMSEAMNVISPENMYSKALEYIDMEAMAKAENLTMEELSVNMAVGGFRAGMKFALENIDITKLEDGWA